MGLGQMFSDPSFMGKLAGNPKTSGLLADPEFVAKLDRVRQNPSLIQEELRDPRMMQVIAVLLGIDIQTGDPGAAAAEQDTPMPDAPKPQEKPHEPTQQEEEDAESKAKKEAKEAADKEKAIGTENYKKRNFDAAIEHYSKAWELYKDITYLNNIAAAKFEAGDLDGCIEECLKAVEEGREMRADFKLIAK